MQLDFNDAEKILLKAYTESKDIISIDENTSLIKEIINGNHKTYKYILITGLLAKAANVSLNPIALQAGAPILGAYDARSLCHKIVVPFERKYIYNALGGSNEPFLNKPARFTHLSESNAVRDGNDRKTLNNLIKIFNSINNLESIDSFQYLKYAINEITKKYNHLEKLYHIEYKFDPTLINIYKFIIKFIEKSFEGETLVLAVATLEKLFWKISKNNIRVISHKVNQSGASSREIGDIDIFENSNYLFSIEVKDKDFTSHDVEHAFNKMVKNNGDKGVFIYGSKASFNENQVRIKLSEYEKMNFYTVFTDIISYIRMTLFRIQLENNTQFIDELMKTAIEINAKETTKTWIRDLLAEQKILN